MTKPITRTDRQLLALTRAAKKYPSVKAKIKQIKKRKATNEWLAQ